VSIREWHWFVERLADPTLLDDAIEVFLSNGYVTLAVPIGGTRRGGYVSLSDRADVEDVLDELTGLQGFPQCRAEYSDDPDVCHVVRWGDDPPALPDEDAEEIVWAQEDFEEGRFYGYSEHAILSLLGRNYPRHMVNRIRDQVNREPA
jgi:hypothetical protein